jgi:hypothetical protein
MLYNPKYLMFSFHYQLRVPRCYYNNLYFKSLDYKYLLLKLEIERLGTHIVTLIDRLKLVEIHLNIS